LKGMDFPGNPDHETGMAAIQETIPFKSCLKCFSSTLCG